MAEEEKSESTGGSLKNILLGLVSTITLGVGGWFTTKLTGGEETAAQYNKQLRLSISKTTKLNNNPQVEVRL